MNKLITALPFVACFVLCGCGGHSDYTDEINRRKGHIQAAIEELRPHLVAFARKSGLTPSRAAGGSDFASGSPRWGCCQVKGSFLFRVDAPSIEQRHAALQAALQFMKAKGVLPEPKDTIITDSTVAIGKDVASWTTPAGYVSFRFERLSGHPVERWQLHYNVLLIPPLRNGTEASNKGDGPNSPPA